MLNTLEVLRSFNYKIDDMSYGPDGNIFHLRHNGKNISFTDKKGQTEKIEVDGEVFEDLKKAVKHVFKRSVSLIQSEKVPVQIEAYFAIKKVLGFKRKKQFEARIIAKTSDGITFFLSPSHNWVKLNQKPDISALDSYDIESGEMNSEDKFTTSYKRIIPDPEIVDPFVKWFRKLSLRSNCFNQTFIWKKDPNSEMLILKHWAEKPNAKYLGNNEFKSLVSYKTRPKYSVRVEPSGIDWFNVAIEIEDELKGLTLDDIESILDSNNNEFVTLPNCGIKYLRSDLNEIRNTARDLQNIGVVWNKPEQDLHVLQLRNLEKSKLEIRDELLALSKDFSGIPDVEIDPKIGLRDYQKKGVSFMNWACTNFGGCLLADDMGLGKTVQVLTTIDILKPEGPSLVICPSSLTFNWFKEAKKFFPNLKVKVIERGSGRKKDLANIKDYDLIVYNYSLSRIDLNYLKEIDWFCIVVDEAQAIKNAKSDLSKTVKALKSKYKIALTGTPIENRLSDLQSIVDFIVPGYLEKTKDVGYIRGKIRPICIRRTKAEVAPDLPERIEKKIYCDMTPKQREIYHLQLKKSKELLEGMSGGQEAICALAELMKLRQICCDPGLLGYDSDSGKLESLLENIGVILEEGHKVLVFSQFVTMIERIKVRLEKAGIKYYELTGKTENRQELVDKFEKDKEPCVFLISLKAGGVGLNLVSASHVIIYDPWWNPAVEAQAIDRTHRIGQDKTVIALKMIAKGTVEEKIHDLQDTKMTISRNVLGDNGFNQSLTKEDFRFILS